MAVIEDPTDDPSSVPVCWFPQGEQPFRYGLLVIAVGTPQTTIRNTARARLRDAVGTVLSRHFRVPREQVRIVAVAGEPPCAELPGRTLHLGFAHEAGLSLAAISQRGPVGIDLMMEVPLPDWPDLARGYLGPAETASLNTLAPREAAKAFCFAWVRLEACLKCRGTGIVEWTPRRDALLAGLVVTPLALPAGYVGALACAPSD